MTVPVAAGADLVRALTRAARSVAARVEPLLKAEGLSLDQWLVLDTLAASGGATMSELAGATLVPGPTLTRVVDRLVLTAAAYREVDPEDRRKVRVYLAPRGKTTQRRIGSALAGLQGDPELVESLRRLAP